MLNFPRWKTISILACIVLAALLALPNVLPDGLQAKFREWNLRPVTLGLDLQGGSNVLLEVDRKDLLDKLSRQLASDVRNTMRDAKIGYSGLTRADDTVRVRVTKPEDADKAETELRKLLNPLDSGMFGAGGQVNLFDLAREAQPTAKGQNPPPECQSFPLKDDPNQDMWVQSSSRASVDGGDLVDARGAFDQSNQPVVSFRFNTKGAERFAKLTRDNVGRPFAIILDEKVVSYPRINEPILGGSGQISGNFSTQETNDLAVVLRSGALPAKLTIVEERTVGPSLGSDSIRAGLIASLIGLVLVLAFMILGYGLFGIFANIALLVNLLALIALMSFFGFTLTLPGIAGIVLTMGMAVDSNVLIYERIREEWRNGRSALSAIETGFKAALGTIWDANLTTLVAALALFGVGSGPIRGFAVTLFIGIVTTMFTAFTLTQLIVAVWVKVKRPREVPL